MAKEMLINVSEGEECRIALLEGGKLEELYMERTSSTSHVNNIYKGRVINVEPSIQAAFVDFGLGRNGFLHISDLMPTYFGRRGEEIQESVGRKMARRDRPPIQRCLRRGDEIVVQVIKEGIGTKGPTLSTYLSIPGKILVMMPGMVSKGVSRKIEDEEERRRLRQILDALDPPEDIGFILRTAGVGKSKAEIERDLKYLLRLWQTIEKKRDSGPGPMELYTEGDLVTRTVRDVFTTDVDKLVVDNKEVAKRIREVVKLSSPRTRNRVELYEDPLPLFHKYGIEKEIEQMYSRHVPLPSGGSLVIDSTEAIVAIDVNSGKFRDHNDAETTAFRTDMEAADEICRQLRLRDLGGVIICDFIDLRFERHRRELEHRLHENLKNDRAKTKVLRMSQFGIIEMTRQRMRPSLKRSVYFDCPHCKGAGLVKTPESMSLDVMRRLAIAVNDQRVVRIEMSVSPEVSSYLQNRKRQQLATLEQENEKRILIKADQTLGLDEMKLDLYDNRDGLVVVEQLAAALAHHPHTTQINVRQPQQPQRGGRGGRDDRRQQHQQGRDRQRQPVEEYEDEEAMESRAEEFEDETGEMEAPRSAPPQQQRGQQQRGQQQQHRGDRRGEEGAGARQHANQNGGYQNGQNRDDEGQGGGRRRRRRRRGRRGRGRGGQQGQGQPMAQGHFDQQQPFSEESGPPEFDLEIGEAPAEITDDEPVSQRSEPDQTEFEHVEVGEVNEEEPVSVDEREAMFATEESDEARPVEEPAAEAPSESTPEAEVPAEPAGKRRRGRRGGRSRKGKVPAAAAEPAAEAPQPTEEEAEKPSKGPRRRGRRGGRGRKKSSDNGQHTAAQKAAEAASPAAEVTEEMKPATVRTGADKHLADDEPVTHEPVRRPRHYRDLDQIPDDYD